MADHDENPARRRLNHAHDLWHEALAAYPDVDTFCREVNGLITTLRTVTWILQKDRTRRPGFGDWYARRQESMRRDPIMRWAVEARNQIEKVGDLDFRSTARVSVLASWLPALVTEFDVDPLVPPAAIGATLAGRDIPDLVREQGTLKVERLWVTIGLPDMEVLEGCAHVYAFLDALLLDAEADPLSDDTTPPRPLGCMIAGIAQRTALIHLASGNLLVPTQAHSPNTENDEAAVRERYGGTFDQLSGGNLEERVRSLHSAGREVLTVDGYHAMVAILLKNGARVGVVAVGAEDQAEKYVLMEQVSQQILEADADEVVVSGESWVAQVLPPGHDHAALRAGQRDDRTEAFMTTGLARDGRFLTLLSEFSRDEDRIVLQDAQVAGGPMPQFLLPIVRAWRGHDVSAPDVQPIG